MIREIMKNLYLIFCSFYPDQFPGDNKNLLCWFMKIGIFDDNEYINKEVKRFAIKAP